MGNINNTNLTGLRSASAYVNFTAANNRFMIPEHKIIMYAYIQAIDMQKNAGSYDVRLVASAHNCSFYKITGYVDSTTTVLSLKFSRILFDLTVLQASKSEYIDAETIVATSSNWAGLTPTLKFYNVSNFMIGMVGIGYTGATGVDFLYNKANLSASGTMSFNKFAMSYWNYRKRSCPAGFPNYDELTDLCFDTCPAYTYLYSAYQSC